MGEQHYPARANRVGIYLTGLLIIAPLVASIALLGVSQPFPAVIMIAVLFVVVVVYALAFKIRYELNDKELRFRQGVFSAWRIPLHSITRVLPAHGHAGLTIEPSDGLLVEAGDHCRLVAPPDPEKFLRELASRAPHLRRYGAELRGAIVTTYGIS